MGGREFYNLNSDPYELNNTYPSLSAGENCAPQRAGASRKLPRCRGVRRSVHWLHWGLMAISRNAVNVVRPRSVAHQAERVPTTRTLGRSSYALR